MAAAVLLGFGVLGGKALAALLCLLIGAGWFFQSPERRRQRRIRLAESHLQKGKGELAVRLIDEVLQQKALPEEWKARLLNLKGECLRQLGASAVAGERYEEALQLYQTAARLQDVSDDDARQRLTGIMLENVRRLCAGLKAAETEAALVLSQRVLALVSPCPEASFWESICYLSQGKSENAIASLRTAHERTANQFFEPAFYLGAIFRRRGQAGEAIRLLAEANRLAPNFGLLSLELGQGLLAAGGDSSFAARALRKACERLESLKTGSPADLWRDGLPEGRSYVRRLAEKHAYVCPIFNSSPAQLLTEARLGLARALGHMGELDEAVETYRRLLRDGPPKPSILGGLGRCLARQGKFEDAYTHLRAAYDQEKAHDPLTVGYLALCGARGRSRTPEDRLKNVSWALDLLDPIGLPGNTEWAELCSSVYAEARSLGLEISRTRQVRLCEILASATLVDPNAAGAYQQLHATHPDGVALPYAWLYCRAVQQYGVAADNDLELFALAFREPREACAYYAARQWDFEEIEIIYLERASVREPGRFPKALGADYPVRGEKLLLERARRQEANGNRAAALATVEVLLKLAPGCLEGIDRLAQLCYRQKNLRRAAELLGDLHRLTPGDPQPLVRQALIEHQLRNRGTWTLILESALKCAQSKDLANIALIGARLAIADLLSAFDSQAAVPAEAPEFQLAMQWLDRCQTFAPSQPETDWCRAALWSWAGVTENLAAQTAKLSDAELEDGRYQFARALSCMAAGRHSEAQAAAERAARLLPTLELECASVIGQACLKAGDKDGALVALQKVAKRNNGLLGDLARAHLGNLEFQSKNLNEAVTWWQSVTPAQRQAWNIDSALPVALLLAGLHDLNDGRFPDAANRFREAGRMGSRERGLGSLLILALVKDAHSHREADNGDRTTEARLLEQAINAGCRDPQLFYSLALARKRLGHFYEARAALSRIADPDALDLLQMGILSLAMNQVEQAEHDFTRAYEKNPDLSVVCHNLLLARLSLGQIQESLSLAERAMHGAATEHDPALWQVLHALLTACTVAEGSLGQEPAFASLDSITEDRLLELIRGLGHLEAMSKLLDALLRARPGRALLRQACQEISLLNAYGAMERCDWTHAEKLLETLASSELASLELSPTLSNMLGCCAMMAKDYHRAALHFDEALQSFPADPSLEQNIALAHEGRAAWPIANKHWDRFFTLLDRGVPSPPGHPDYVKKLHHAALSRLASNYVSLECWAEALTYAQRLANLHPDDKENQERLFHLYSQAGLTDEARRALRRLRQTWPGEPFLDLPETDLYDATALEGIDVGLDEVDRLLQRRLSDGRAEMRVFDLIGAVIPLLEKGLTQLWDQFTRVTAQLRHLPHYQVDWSTVHESTSDLRNELGRLRRLISKCSKLVQDDQQRAQLDELYKEVEQKLRQCRAVRA